MARSASRLWIAVASLLLVLVAAQALTQSTAPATERLGTTRAMGRAGFAYLTGLRTFAAAVLWNRLDPLFHEYYSDRKLTEQVQMLPTLRMIQWLDPQFEQAYYVSSYLIARRGDVEEGLRIAREGVASNPRSGLLRANLAQVLMVADRTDVDAMLEQARGGLAPDTQWSNTEDMYEGYVIFKTVYSLAGDSEMEARLDAALEKMRADGIGLGDHDHDGDGAQDH